MVCLGCQEPVSIQAPLLAITALSLCSIVWMVQCRTRASPPGHCSPCPVKATSAVGASHPSSTPSQVRVLVEEGRANFDVRDGYSMDPLDEAMRHRHEAVAAVLRSHGALIGGREPL